MSDPIFQSSLTDLIKGIRSHKRDAPAFISQAIATIKTELRSTDTFLKAEAIRKLTYLQMIGYNISWASFAIVEVMSQQRFAQKRVGYLAACQSFTETTDVVLLTTNLFKKEFAAAQSNQYEIGLAINCLANIATADLARDCIADLVNLMGHSRPYVRKKAVLSLYKLYIKYPQGLRLTFEKLKEKLDDPEPSVVSTAVNVICELANRNPQNYLAMAPKFFKLLTTSSNNWMLIKVVKLLGSLVSEEPRLARKLLEPLSTIITSTTAKSLQYECIHTVTEALPFTKREDGTDSKSVPAVVKICSDYLRGFIEDADQNLKYLGLVGLVNLMKSSPKSVVDHRELVLRCLNDDDVTIRSRALELLAGIVSRKSLVDLVHHLLEHAKHSEGNYRDEIIAKILYMCSKEKYALVTDFAWYTSILLHLAVMPGSKHGKEVADQLIEISLRVDTVRPFAVESMLSMLMNDSLILGQARATVSEVLKAAAWIVGEYSEALTKIANDVDVVGKAEEEYYWIEGPTGEDLRSVWRGEPVHVLALKNLLHPRATNLPPHVQSAYILSAMKIFLRACSDCKDSDLQMLISVLRTSIGVFLQSPNVEVQERASTLRHILAEFGVLDMGWEAAAEAAKRAAEEEKKAPKSSAINDLLDMPAYSADLSAVDESGTKAAQRHKRVLAALTQEPFYSVHSKAQKRVPVPEGLNLDSTFNSAALKALLETDIPENLTIQNLWFTEKPPPSAIPDRGPNGDDEDRIGRLAKSTFGIDYATGETKSYSSFQGDHSTMMAPPQGRSAEDNLFYLVGKGNASDTITPLSQILADTFEDKKVKRKKGEAKAKKVRTDEIDTREMLPAGAVDSDEEGGKKGGRRPKSRGRKGEESLDNVDVTTKLREDEVLPVLKHREVPTHAAEAAENDKADKKKGKKEGKGKKDKKDGGEKKPKEGKAKKGAVVDLLSLDWDSSSSSAAAAAPAVAAAAPASASKEKGKKLGKMAWIPLHSDRGVSVFYSAAAVGSTSLAIHFKCVNANPEGARISAEVTVHSGGGGISPANAGSTAIARGLSVNDEVTTTVSCSTSGPLVSSTLVPVTLRVSVEGFAGSDARQAELTARVSLCAGFLPHKVDEEGFAALLGKSAKWGEARAKVTVIAGAKAKSTLKNVGLFLRAHQVEAEVTKAASFASKCPSGGGGSVCCLAKCSKDGSTVTVDVKVLCANKTESQTIADAIASSLSELTF